MVGPFGEVLVLDWGIAKIRGVDATITPGSRDAEPAETGAGVVMGTAGFMAPEQGAGGSASVDQRADVYSLGAVLRDILVGADRPAAPALRAIRDRAMAVAVEARYASVVALGEDLTRFLDGERVLAYRESPVERIGRFARRHRVAISLVGAYLLMRLLLLAFGRS
jgi:serine/threonine protein kinase